MIARYNQCIPMRDGVVLRHDLYAPDSVASYPVILMRTPYGKQAALEERIYADYEALVGHGYCVAIQDVRGTGASDGILKSTAENEFFDGFDTVQALAADPCCNGNVGMYGLSYHGFTQIAAAVEAPEALRCICPFEIAALVPFGSHPQRTLGGYHIYWLYGQTLAGLARLSLPPAQEAALRNTLQQNLQRMPELLLHLPLRETPALQVDGVTLLQDYSELIDQVEQPSFWERIHRPPDYSKLSVPMLHLTGWFDVALNGTLDSFALASREATPFSRAHQWLIIGPWTHGGFLDGGLEGESFGPAADGLAFDVPGLMRRFMDAFLRNQADAMQSVPTVQYFQLGDNVWCESDEWPPRRVTETPLYLHANGTLARNPPQSPTDALQYVYNPQQPFPSDAADAQGRTFLRDYQPLFEREDVLTFHSQPSSSPLKIVGRLRMELYAASSAVDTDFVCIIGDEAPDGSVRRLSFGLTRARFRHGPAPEPLVPNQCNLFTIDAGNTAYTLPAGHRLIVAVTSSCYPLHNVNLNDGLPVGRGTNPIIATQTLHMGTDYPSQLVVPVMPEP